jgi:Domain of unknown function (DUF1887)
MKAQLILVGGRPIPNILTIIHEKPDKIFAVCSHESIKGEWIQLKQAIEKLSSESLIEETATVDAFDCVGIKETCIQVFSLYPYADWIFNATTATSLMTLGAYMAADHCEKLDKASIKFWYLDTAHSRVISLIGNGRDISIFKLDVEQYVAAYNYRLQPANGTKNYQSRFSQEDWMTFAKRLGESTQDIDLLKQILLGSSANKYNEVANTADRYHFLRDLEKVGLIHNFTTNEQKLRFYLSDEQHKYLDGAWLELYIFQEAMNIGFFDYIQWSKEIIDNDPNRDAKSPLSFNEIDVAVTYKAHFMIIECKTGKAGFETKTLDDIVTMADLIGRGFVTKVLVTSKSSSDSSKDFKTKAKIKGIHIITLEDLPQVGTKLEELAEKSMRSGR